MVKSWSGKVPLSRRKSPLWKGWRLMKFQEKRKITVVHCLVSISASVLVLFFFFFCLLFLQSFSFLRDFGGDISITSLKVTLKSSVKYRHTIKHFFVQLMLLSHEFVALRIGGWKDQQNS